MARRTRKRYGNDGGGFPLGQILALAMGGGEANPAFGAKAPGDVDPSYSGDPDEAIKKFGTTNPNRPSNIFQKFYGMDYGDQANEDYRLGKIQAEEALQRQLGAIPQVKAAQADADIAAAKKSRQEIVARLAPTLSRAGLLPPNPLNDQAATEDFLNLYGQPSGEIGAYPAFGAGQESLLKGRRAQAQQDRAPEEGRTDQVAKIAKGKLSITQDELDRAVLDIHRDKYIKGREGQMDRERYLQVGPIAYDVTDPQNFLSYIMPGDGITPSTPPQPFAVRDGMAIFPTAAKPAPSPAPAPAKTTPSASKPMSGSAPYTPPAFFQPGGMSPDMFGTTLPAPKMAPYTPSRIVTPQAPDPSGAFGVPLQPSLTPALTPEALEEQRRLLIRQYLMER